MANTEVSVNVTAEVNQELLDKLNAVYYERDQCVVGLAKLAQDYGLNCGIGKDENAESPEWENVVYIDLPAGQVSWHVPAREIHLFSFLDSYNGKWDGHDTEEKYRRVMQMFPKGPLLPPVEG